MDQTMRTLTLVSLLLLASCQSMSWGGAADVLMPDELTIGQGNSTINTLGGYTGHNDMFEYEGEGESTYAALTWSLPSFEDDSLSRDERRVIRDFYAQADEVESEDDDGEPKALQFKMPTMKGRKPPTSVAFGLIAFLVMIVVVVVAKSKKKDPWN